MFRFILFFVFFFSAPLFAIDKFVLDPSHTQVVWQISHFDFSQPSGKWMAEGMLMLDEKNPQNSAVTATVHVNNMITGIPKLDEHLQSADFFDTAKYPTAIFVSDKVVMTSKKSAKVQGMLTLHGVTKPVTLNVTLRKLGMSPITNKKTAGFTATADIKRSDFGMKTYLPGLGDQVKLQIESEATAE